MQVEIIEQVYQGSIKGDSCLGSLFSDVKGL